MLVRIIIVPLFVYLVAAVQAAPLIDVTADSGGGLVNWVVTLSPDSDSPLPGGTGSISAEVGFEFDSFGGFTEILSATIGPDFAMDNVPAGHNPFDEQSTSGLVVDVASNTLFNTIFVAATAEYQAMDDPLVLLTFSTDSGSRVAWGGQTILTGTPEEFTGARITQDGVVHDAITGTDSFIYFTYPDANVDGTVNGDDIPDIITALLDLSDWQILHPGLDPLFYMDGNFDGQVNNDDIPPFVRAVLNPPFLTQPTAVPEPQSVVLLCLGSATVFCFTQRRRRGC